MPRVVRAPILLLILAACAIGCARETQRPVVIVHVDGLDGRAVAERATIFIDGRRATELQQFAPAVSEFSLALPVESTGHLRVDLSALDKGGAVIARGRASALIDGIGARDVTLRLDAGLADRVLVADTFGDGDPETTGDGVGGGWTEITWSPELRPMPGGVSASESGGLLRLGGTGVQNTLQGRDALDPTGTTLRASIDTRPAGAAPDTGKNGFAVGWTMPDEVPCCAPAGVNFDLSDDRVAFEIRHISNWEPSARYVEAKAGAKDPDETFDPAAAVRDIEVSFTLGLTSWSLDATGPGLSIHRYGPYPEGQTLADAVAKAGGSMRPFISVGRMQAVGTFKSVTITGPPPGYAP